MTINKKLVTLLVCAVVMTVGAVSATMAYFTDSEQATNTFTVGHVDITLDEADVDDSTPGKDRDTENQYKDIIPGHTYPKDPTVTVKANSDDCYVRMLVTINKQEELDAVFAPVGGLNLSYFFEEYVPDTWSLVGESENESENTRTYTFNYIGGINGVVEKADTDTVLTPLFKAVSIPGAVYDTPPNSDTIILNIGNEEMKAFEGLKIDVVAHAIQAAGFENAEEAWTQFK